MARTEISTLGEFGLIRHLTKDIKHLQPSTIKGVGDDCAVMNFDQQRVLMTTDMLLEGIHFNLDTCRSNTSDTKPQSSTSRIFTP